MAIISKIYLFNKYNTIDVIISVSSIEAILSAIIIFILIKEKIIKTGVFVINIDQIINFSIKFAPLLLMSLLLHIYTKIDSYMISYILGAKELAKYSIGTKFSTLVFPLAAIITNSFYPELISSYKKSTRTFVTKLIYFYRICFITSIVIALLLFFLANPLLIYMYGSRYLDSCSVQSIYCWTLLFMFTIVSSSRWFLLKNYNKFLLLRALWGALINIFLNLILIDKYGINGAAISTFLSLFFIAFIFDYFNKETRLNLYYKLLAFKI